MSTVKIFHYKVLSLENSYPLQPNSVYYELNPAEVEGGVSTINVYITDLNGIPISIQSEGTSFTLTGTGVTGTFTDKVVNISTFLSTQIGNLMSLSTEDGKLFVKPITSPDGSISITPTAEALQIGLSQAIQDVINSALQEGDNISVLTNDAGYITSVDLQPLAFNGLSIQNTFGTEQFVATESLRVKGTTFDAMTKEIQVNPLVGGAIFVSDTVGNDVTAIIENRAYPFKTLDAAMDAFWANAGINYIEILDTATYTTDKPLNNGGTRSFEIRADRACVVNITTNGIYSGTASGGVYQLITFNLPKGTINFSPTSNTSFGQHSSKLPIVSIVANTVTTNSFIVRNRVREFYLNARFLNMSGSTGFVGGSVGTSLTTIIVDTITFAGVTSLVGSNAGTRLNIDFNNIIHDNTFSLFGDGSTSTVINHGGISGTYAGAAFGYIGGTANAPGGRVDITYKAGFTISSNVYINLFNSTSLNLTITGICNYSNADKMMNGLNVSSSVNIINANITCKVLTTRFTKKLKIVNSIINILSDRFVDSSQNIGGFTYEVPLIEFVGTNYVLGVTNGFDLIQDDSPYIQDNKPSVDTSKGVLRTNGKFNRVKIDVIENPLNQYYDTIQRQVVIVNEVEEIANQVLDPLKTYFIDGELTLGASDQIIVPPTGLNITGYGFDRSIIKSTTAGHVMFVNEVGGSGDLNLDSLTLNATGAGASYFDLKDINGFHAVELVKVNFNDGEIGIIDGYRQGLWSNVGLFGVEDGLVFEGEWLGGFRNDQTIVRTFGSSGTIFKKGSSTLFRGRFLTDINADLPVGASLSDFVVGNFNADRLYQIKDAQITRAGAIDDTQNYTGTITHNSSVSDWQGNTGIKNSPISPYGVRSYRIPQYSSDALATLGGVPLGETYKRPDGLYKINNGVEPSSVLGGYVRVESYGAVADGVTISTVAIQAAINANVGKVVRIGSNPLEVYLIDQEITIPAGSIIQIDGEVKLVNAPTQLLTANVSNGQNTLSVANANLHFKVGDRIVFSDDNQPINGGGAWKTRKVGTTGVVTAVNSTTLTFANPWTGIIGGSCTIAANAKVAKADNMFTCEASHNTTIFGKGVLNGNKANRWNIAGATWNHATEDLQSNTGITFGQTNNFKILGNLTIKNFVMHGISTTILSVSVRSYNCIIDGVTIDGVVDKSILGLQLMDSRISNIRNINGVDEGEICLYSGCYNNLITDIYCENNKRYGVAIINNFNGNNTINNVTCKNVSAAGIYIQNQLEGTNISNIVCTGTTTEGSAITINSSRNVDIKNLRINGMTNSLALIGVSAGTTFSTISEGIRFDGVGIKDCNRAGSYTIALDKAVDVLFENFTIDGVVNMVNDISVINENVVFRKGIIKNVSGVLSNLISSTTSRIRFKEVTGDYMFETSSVATMPTGSTYIIITHGLAVIPKIQDIRINPIGVLGSATKWWVSNINSTDFRINVDVAPAVTTAKFRWNIETYLGEPIAEAVYTNPYNSDFSVGVDGWAGTNTTLTGNNDAVTDGTTSYDDVLKVFPTVTNGSHDFSKAIYFANKVNRLTFKLFIPVGQAINGIRIYHSGFSIALEATIATEKNVLGTWYEVTTKHFTPTSTACSIRLMTNYIQTFVGVVTEYVALKDMKIEYLP